MAETFNEEARQIKFRENHITKLLTEQNYQKLTKAKTKFTDDLFPPEESSIYSGKTDFSNPPKLPKFVINQLASSKNVPIRTEKKNYVWKRITELYSEKELNILKEPPTIKEIPDILTQDVIQGELGDCYFLSVLSALAENPKRIKNLFSSLNIHPNGVFEVKVVIHGEIVPIVVDDYFPCNELEDGSFELAFTKLNPTTKNLWPLILEKAWAKINLNYENVINGNAGDAFEFLSISPFDSYYHDVQGINLFEIISEADKQGYLICTSISETEKTPSIDNLAKLGLITNHAYTVISVHEFTELSGKKIGLLKLRNPWGSNEWKGDYSDDSNKWTPELKELVNFKKAEDGIFFISIEDYIHYYTQTFISRFHDSYSFNSSKFTFDSTKHYNFVQLKVPKESDGYIILNQKNTRLYRVTKGLTDFENHYASVVVFKETGDNNFHIVGCNGSREDRIFIEKELTDGTYYVGVSYPVKLPNSDYSTYKQNFQKHYEEENLTYRLGVYSKVDKLSLSEVSEKDYERINKYFANSIFNKGASNQNKYNFVEEGEKDVWRSVAYDESEGSLGYIVYHNPSNAYIHEKLSFWTLVNTNIFADINENVTFIEDSVEAIEDQLDRKALDVLRKREYPSSFIIRKESDKIDKKRRIDIEVNVAPRSNLTVILEKYEEDAEVAFDSNLVIEYPLHTLLLENSRFNHKRNKIKYNTKLIEIYETIIEHNSGVIFKYKNKTRDLKFTALISFKKIKNLELTTKSIDLGLEGEVESENISELKPNEFTITLEPGQSQFVELKSVDFFQNYSYENDINYTINLSRTTINK